MLKGTVQKTSAVRGGCLVQTFCEEGWKGDSSDVERPHFLVQKT